MAASRDKATKSAGVSFTKDSAKEIAETVRVVRGGDRKAGGIYLPRAACGSSSSHTRLGTISATWSKGSTATVTQINGDGTAIDGSPTFTAKNYFANVTVTSGTKKVACARVGETWILIAAEC